MNSKDLKVVNLNITEDNYEYKAMFRLCTDDKCIDVDMAGLSDDSIVSNIKEEFGVEESIEDIRKIITEKIMEATKIESKISQGENFSDEVKDKDIDRKIDSLSRS